MKKILPYLLCAVIAGNTAFAATSAQDTANVSIVAVTLPTLTVDDIDFGTYVLGDPNPKDETASVSLQGGTPQKLIRLSVPEELILTKAQGSETAEVAMSLDNSTSTGGESISDITLGALGDADSTLTASVVVAPTVAGDYSGTVTVTAAYY